MSSYEHGIAIKRGEVSGSACYLIDLSTLRPGE
jgi:hypothetical protein